MELYSFNPKNLNFNDSGEFIVRYLTDIKNQNIDLDVDHDFKDLHNSLVAQSPIYNKALAQIKAKSESKDLLNLDHIRDKKISTLRTQLRVAKDSDVPEVLNAFGKIKVVINAYKGLEFKNYPTETLGINNLIAELRSATNQPFSDLLSLNDHITNLDKANTNFVAKFDSRSSDVISTETYDTKVLRKTMLATYVELTDYVVVIAKRRNNPYYDKLITTINYSRQYFKPIVSSYGATPPSTPPTP